MKYKTFLLVLTVLITVSNLEAQELSNIKVKTILNKNVSLKTLYSKGPVLITFWALWCEPCKEEMKHLTKIYEKYKGKGFSIFSFNEDSPKSVSKVRAYIASHRIKFDVTLDPNNQFLQLFNGQSIPYAILINTKGKIEYKQIGYLPGDEIKLEKEIKKHLDNND